MEIKFQGELSKSKVKVFLISEKKKLGPKLEKLDKDNDGIISRSIKNSEFNGKNKKFLSIFLNDKEVHRVILAGTGKEKQDNVEKSIRDLGGEIFSFLSHAKIKDAAIIFEDSLYGFAGGVASANMAYGVKLKSYNFDKYFTNKKDDEKPTLKSISLSTSSAKEAKTKFEILEAIAEGVFLARDVVSEPPNAIYPESYALRVRDELKALGAKVDILGEKELKKLGMGSLLCVGQGSERESKVVVIQWNGSSDKKSAPVAFVGKGVTFDTGGISLKPSNGMEDMKYDMGGSAAVVGVMKALAGRKAKVNAVGVVGLVENMPDGQATRPSDVVTSMSGQTIEVLNTDAEGRLVLADCLWYTQNKFKPKFMIDLATLTGACVIALGTHKAGLMSNDDKLANQIFDAGEEVGENVWRLPLGKEYDKQMDSKIADMQNISNTKGGGTITAGQFLQRFVNEKTWAHIDIAGVAWASKSSSTVPQGAVGYGVQLLDRLVENNYED